MSNVTRDLIKLILVADPSMRLELSEIKQHKFFRGLDWQKVVDKEYTAPFLPPYMHISNLLQEAENELKSKVDPSSIESNFDTIA